MTINLNDIISLSETIEVEESVDGLTAMSIFKLHRDTFESLGLDFVNSKGNPVVSQNTYNDSRNGQINGVKGGGPRRFTEDEAIHYVATKVAKARR